MRQIIGYSLFCRVLIRLVFLLAGCLIVPLHAGAGAWTLPKGRLWVKSSFFFQSTDEQFCSGHLGFCSRHERAPFDPFTGGRSRSAVVFNELAYGFTDRLDLGVQIPFYSLEFRDLGNPTRPRTQRIGDIRFYARYRLLAHPVVASIRVGAKSPTGGINVDAEVVPIGEGQWDYEFFGDVGRSLTLIPGYVNLSLGYRQRTVNQDFNFKPGDEFTLLAEGGWQASTKIMAKASVGYLYSANPRALSITFKTQRRELLSITPAFLWTPYRTLTVETGVQLPVRGQDVPAGPQFNIGLMYTFDLLGRGAGQ